MRTSCFKIPELLLSNMMKEENFENLQRGQKKIFYIVSNKVNVTSLLTI